MGKSIFFARTKSVNFNWHKRERGRMMSIVELFFIAVGLSMDAFAVSICKGLAMQKCTLKKAGIVGLWFGAFQAGMPLLGYILGIQFQSLITSIDHWIAFILLGIIGGNMVHESFSKEEEEDQGESLAFKIMLGLAIATSIDALAIGVTFAFLNVEILPAIACIGITTFVLSAVGVKIGHVFGNKYKNKAELAGGMILIILGIKILVEHLGIIG